MLKQNVVIAIVAVAIVFAILSTFTPWAKSDLDLSTTLWKVRGGNMSIPLNTQKAQTAQAFSILMPIFSLAGILVMAGAKSADGLKVGIALLALAVVSGIVTLSVTVSGNNNVAYGFGMASNVIAWLLVLTSIIVTAVYNKQYL